MKGICLFLMLLVSGVSMRGARCGEEWKWVLSGGHVWLLGQRSMAGRPPSPSFPFFPFYHIPLYLNHRTMVEFSYTISWKSAGLRFSDIHNPSLRFLHRWISFTLFPMVELCSVTTVELKCLFAMVNKIKYTPVDDIVDYFTNVSKISGPIECTSLVTRIAMNHG
jgi:hypothetical protein